MVKHTNYFIGIDVSKLTFDAAIMQVINFQKQAIQTSKFDNTEDGLKKFEKWLKSFNVSFDKNSILVIENTGIYHRMLWAFCNKIGLEIHIGNAAHIKWSFGLVRGKNDKVDSIRLCNYAQKHAEELKSSPSLSPVFMQLKDLQTSRNRLMKQKSANEVYLKELKTVSDKAIQKELEKVYKTAIEGIKNSIKAIELLIKKIISEDNSLIKNYKLLISIPGIGEVTAIYLIICTNNFAGNISGKQLACYAGVAPFANTSGTSIKGKQKVHKMADKQLKKILYMCAMASINYCPEISHYYKRKKEEGKHPWSVMNAIKNKLILRAVAVVKNQKPFVNNFVIPVERLKKAG